MADASDPAYLRVLEDLRTQIREGLLGPGSRVPSRNGIMARYGVGETAAKHALQVLAAEGLIETRAGSGSYVRAIPATRYLDHDRLHFPGSPFGMGAGPGAAGTAACPRPDGEPAAAGNGLPRRLSWEHETQRVVPPPHIARRLGLAGQDLATRTAYLLTADGSPVQFATSYEPAALTADTPVAFPEQGPFAGRGVAERMHALGVSVDQVAEDISVRPSLTAEASVLGIAPGAPALVIERAHQAAGRVVEISEIVVPADRFRLRYLFPLPPAAAAEPAAAVPAAAGAGQAGAG